MSIPTRWNPTNVPAPVGTYSHLVAVPTDAQLVFISGQVGARADGSIAPGAYEQTQLIMANIEAMLGSIGATPEHLVRLLTFVAGRENVDDWARARNEAYARWFPGTPVPGHSMLVAEALFRPEILVEVEGWVAVPGRR